MKNQLSIRNRKRRRLIHASGDTCCLNCIFKKEADGNYTKDALLYQNILEYFKIREAEQDQNIHLWIEPESFTTRDLTRWLLNKNLEFAKYYSGLNRYTTISTRIANRLETVQQFVHELEKLQLLAKMGFEEASTNKIPTPTYKLSNFGVIVLLLIMYVARHTHGEGKPMLCRYILQLFQECLKHYNSYISDFIIRLYSKAIEIGLSKSLIDLLLIVIHGNKHTIRTLVDAFNLVLHTHLMDGRTRNYFMNIWMETLKEFPEDVRKIIIYHEKAEIESRIHLAQPPKDWEETWFRNIQNYSQLTLYGKCNQCSKKYPIMVDYYEYRREILPDKIMKRNCLKCKAENSMVISTNL